MGICPSRDVATKPKAKSNSHSHSDQPHKQKLELSESQENLQKLKLLESQENLQNLRQPQNLIKNEDLYEKGENLDEIGAFSQEKIQEGILAAIYKDNDTKELLKIACPKNHPYKWCTDLSFYYYNQNKGWGWNCILCKEKYSTAGWHCRECSVELCVSCSSSADPSKRLIKPVLSCLRNHDLRWSPSTCAFYQENKSLKYLFTCFVCKKSYQEPSWNCAQCSFDICLTCARNKGLNPPRDLLICTNQHPLKFTSTLNNMVKCSICKDSINKRAYMCETCNFYMCYPCATDRFTEMIGHPGLRCTNSCTNKGKNVYLSVCPIEGYRKKSQRLLSCMSCGVLDMKSAYICIKCCQCYCLNCGRLIEEFIENVVGRKCEYQHEIDWHNTSCTGDDSYVCSVCEQVKVCGVFYCSVCVKNYCIKDVGSLNYN